MKLAELSSTDALILTLAAMAGGILPDIDLKYSTPGKTLFTVLGALLALAWLFANIHQYPVLTLWAIALSGFLVVRYPLWWLFHQFTVHRGALHSLAAGMMFCFATSAGAFHLLSLSPLMSWMSGLFLALGYTVHLLLDELFAVDFLGARINHRFGTALKIIDMQRLFASCLVVFAALVLWFWTPSATTLDGLWQALADQSRRQWADALLPQFVGR